MVLGLGLCSVAAAQVDAGLANDDITTRIDKAIADYEATTADKQKAAQRKHALLWLGEIDHSTVVAYLQKELVTAGDTPFAAVVLEAIAKVPRPTLQSEFSAALQRVTAPPVVRSAAATALVKLGDRSIDHLIELVRGLGDDDKDQKKDNVRKDDAKQIVAREQAARNMARDAAIGALVASGGDRAHRGLAPLLLEGSAASRLSLLRRMQSVHGVPPVSAARIHLVLEAELELAVVAWRQLALEKHERSKALAVDVLERLVGEPKPIVAAELIGGLALVQDADFYPLLLRFGSIPGEVVRRALRDAAPAAATDRALMTWLVKKGLEDDRPAAREAAKLLLTQAPLEVVQPLVARVRAEIRSGKKRSLEFAMGLHELLAKDPTWVADLRALVESPDVKNRVVAFSLLLELGADTAILAAQENLGHKAWELRSVCLRYLTRFRDTSTIPLLIARFEHEDGRLLHELHEALFAHTGTRCWQKKEWDAWWLKNKVGFVLPHEETVRRGAGTGGGKTVSYYDIPLVSSRVAFLVDTSGSMLERIGTDRKFTRLDAAKEQLTHVLASLPAETHCNLVDYDTKVRQLWDQLRKTTEENRQDMLKFVKKLAAAAGTNIFDALELAFKDPDVDTIYLLTDGQPTAGRLVNTEDILDEVQRWNRQRQIVIHCISIGLDSDLLKRLAKESGGSYKYVQ